jgi:hypothetical protein
MKLPIA